MRFAISTREMLDRRFVSLKIYYKPSSLRYISMANCVKALTVSLFINQTIFKYNRLLLTSYVI